MSLSKLWDRAWWGFMIFIAVGLVWLKFLDPILACVWPGILFSAICGGIYIYIGVRKMRREKDSEEE